LFFSSVDIKDDVERLSITEDYTMCRMLMSITRKSLLKLALKSSHGD